MKQIKAEIIADSVNEFGNRITSYILTFPRIILAEAKTHRVLKGLLEEISVSESVGVNDDPNFSRNSASSRAIPFPRMVEMVKNDPFIPIAWQKDHKGMQGTEYFESNKALVSNWLAARDEAVNRASILSEIGVTKQVVNRLLEPFMWHTAIVTATEFENFFALRSPQYEIVGTTYRSKKDVYKVHDPKKGSGILEPNDPNWFLLNKGQGEIHIMALAEAMWDAKNASVPKQLYAGEWHIPFGDRFNIELAANAAPDEITINTMIKIATARCARVSYMNFEGTDDYGKDIALHDGLSMSGHWSPFEHCARAMSNNEMDNNLIIQDGNTRLGASGNFFGFVQYRKLFSGENKDYSI